VSSSSAVELPREHVRHLPSDVKAVCLMCLEKSPEDRYPSADALVRDLERLIRGERTRGPVGWVARSCRNAPQRPLHVALFIGSRGGGGALLASPPRLVQQRFAEASNAAGAEEAAETLRREFTRYAARAVDATRDERVVRLLQAPTPRDNAVEL